MRWLPASVEGLLRVALWFVLLAGVAYTRTDPDLWGHVRFGLDLLHDKRLPAGDPYSFTSDQAWVNHEWAAEAVSAAAFALARGSGLVLLKLLVIGGTMLLLVRTLAGDGVLDPRHRDWIGGAAVITTVQQAHNVRPQIFSLLLFTILLACLLRSSKSAGRSWLLPIPPLFAVWSNFHGGWIVGGLVLILWTTGAAIRARHDGARPVALLVATGAAALLATLVNPYGFGLWRFLWSTVGIGRAEITDWQPVYVLGAPVWGLWILTAALAAIGVFRTRTSLDARRILPVLALAAGSLLVNRLLAFFALSTLLMYGAAIVASRPARVVPAAAPDLVSRLVGIALGTLMIAGGCVALAINVRCLPIDERTVPEPDAVAVLEQQTAGTRLLVWFDWGEYAIWHLGPRMRVSIDGRRETVYSADLQQRHLRFFFDTPGSAGLARDLQADYVWIPRELPAAGRLRRDGWTPVYEGGTSVIFQRAGLAAIGAPPVVPTPKARCFPAR